jgi:RNA polymerase sigma factor (sigma-70 family)
VTLGDNFPEVLAAARTGAEWAWSELYRHLAPTVLGYLRLRGAPDPEDTLGEVFLQVVTGLDKFDGGEAEFRTWVMSLAHRRAIDAYRRAARRPAVPVGDALVDLAGGIEDVEAQGLDRLQAARALRVIRTLSPDQQDVLLLRLVAGLTGEEVAEVLGKRVTAVKALQRRGLAALRKKLSDQGVSR